MYMSGSDSFVPVSSRLFLELFGGVLGDVASVHTPKSGSRHCHMGSLQCLTAGC